MRVTRVAVKGLFGIFNHDIRFKPGRITIIHGPNGYGKTFILKMLNALLSGTYGILHSAPYRLFTVAFDNGSVVTIQKTGEQLHFAQFPSRGSTTLPLKHSRQRGSLRGEFVDENGGVTPLTLGPSSGQLSERMRRDLDRLLPANMRMTSKGWLDRFTGQLHSVEGVIGLYGDLLRSAAPELLEGLGYDATSPLRRVQKAMHVHVIGTERLDKKEPSASQRYVDPEEPPPPPMSTVERYSQEIVAKIGGVLASYAGRAAELDRTFPQRLLLQRSEYTPTTLNLKQRFTAIEEQRLRLIDLGFLDREPAALAGIPEELYDTQTEVLSVYVADMENKLSTFSDMSERVGLFMKIVNSRFSHKSLRISREHGFMFESSLGQLSPSDLSSGEQHELVLLYELLFKVEKNWLVMLDEPEISLHVRWQKRFLGDLQDIVKLSDVDVLIATHSPVIIGNHWDDLTVELGEPEGEEAE